MDTITDILARPDEAARQLAEMRAALEAVTAQLAAKDAELSELRLAVQRDILSRLDVTLPQLAAVTAERDAARAEVARLKEEVEGAYEAHNEAVTILERRLETYSEAREMVLKALPEIALQEAESVWGVSNTAPVRKALSFLWHCAVLRGDTAPAQPAGTNVVSLNSLSECDTCGHLMVDHDRTDDGRRVCMRLGCNCLEPASAGRE